MATPISSQVQVSHRTTTLGPPIVHGTKDRNILSKLERKKKLWLLPALRGSSPQQSVMSVKNCVDGVYGNLSVVTIRSSFLLHQEMAQPS
jgi:hypothetical protein